MKFTLHKIINLNKKHVKILRKLKEPKNIFYSKELVQLIQWELVKQEVDFFKIKYFLSDLGRVALLKSSAFFK